VAYVEVTPGSFWCKQSKTWIKIEFETRRGCQTNLYGRAKFILSIVQIEGQVCYRVGGGNGFDFGIRLIYICTHLKEKS
jgi:hypothetical protein